MNENLPAKIRAMRELLGKATPDCSCGLPTCLGCKADWDVSVEARNALPEFLDFMEEAILIIKTHEELLTSMGAQWPKEFLKKHGITSAEGK